MQVLTFYLVWFSTHGHAKFCYCLNADEFFLESLVYRCTTAYFTSFCETFVKSF